MDFIKPYTSLIESELEQFVLPAKPTTLYDPQRYILSSVGKRIRPILVLLGCGLCGKDFKKAVPAALAVELVHNFTLIHDDIMDQAEIRRGNLPVHLKWDESTAILSGDSLFVQALLQLQKFPEEVDYKRVNKVFLEGVNHVCEGQALDMEFEKRLDVTSEEYLTMIGGKTAALISVSLVLGGLAANASNDILEQLDDLGQSLGLAFQVQDDLMDLTADPEKFGKKQGGDIWEGKKTFLMVRTLESCNTDEREWLTGRLENRPLTSDDVREVLKLYKKYRVNEKAEVLLNTYYEKAINILDRFGDSTYKQDLQNLINYLKQRDS
ncbi:MAG: polyprenyl synthetase family protein [Balneolaceae bacterium]|nr:polyprenyl synthetase family protein [Balneolaceae bacterium]